MKAVQIAAHDLTSIKVVEVEDRDPGPGEVLLEMRAASVNYRDLAVASGRLGKRLPLIPLSDGVGVVEAVGADVARVAIGDRVAPIYAPRWLSGPMVEGMPALGGELDGVLRKKMVVDAQALVKIPAHLTDAEAATLTVAGVTAWSAVVEFGRVKPGDVVLVQGTGGLALFALQLAKLAGAQVAIISSSGEKLERAQALGADFLVNYAETPEWGAEVARQTGGVNLVVETVGAQTLAQSLGAVTRGARIAQVGFLGGVGASLPLQLLVPRGVQLSGIIVGGRDRFEQLLRAVAAHRLRPVVGSSFAFDALPAALGAMAKGNFGKIVLEIA